MIARDVNSVTLRQDLSIAPYVNFSVCNLIFFVGCRLLLLPV